MLSEFKVFQSDLPINRSMPLSIKNLSLSINEHRLIDNINLFSDDPGISAIIGPNGAGKSLLIRLMHGLIEPTCGQITWNGQHQDIQRRRHQALVFQSPVLLRRNVAANIDFVIKKHVNRSKIDRDELLNTMGLYEHKKQPARALSGGEKQCLALARALASQPDTLFLDEPTSSLDPVATMRIENLLTQISNCGVKVILVTHDINQAKRLASEIIFMHKGEILEHTSCDNFLPTTICQQAKEFINGQLIF